MSTNRSQPLTSFRLCFALYCVAFFLCFWSAFIKGYVIFPDRQDVELGAPTPSNSGHIENRKFNDAVQGYMPDTFVILKSKRSGWLASWDPYNELGRPIYNQSILSPAFLPTLPLSWIISDPFKLVTAVTLLASFLAGLFALLFAKEWGLRPWSCLFAAITLGLGPTLIYWATFPMVAPTYAWSLAAYWSILKFARRGNFASWGFLVFSIYGLLMTGYPQLVVYNVYIGLGLTLYLGYQLARRHSLSTCAKRFFLPLLLAGACGLLLSLPAMLDTYAAALASARVRPDIIFFRAVLPDFSLSQGLYAQIALWAFPQLYGNPVKPDFIALYGGLSLAPAAIFFVLAPSFRHAWGWWLCVAALLLVAISDHAFAFAVRHLGMSLSRTNPLAVALIPFTMIAATQLDAFQQEGVASSDATKRHRRWRLALAASLYLAFLFISCVVHPVMHAKVHMAVAYLAVLALCVIAVEKAWPALVVIVAITWLCLVDRNMLLTQPRPDIVTSSPIVRVLQSQTLDGSRLALVATEQLLPPNINAELGLESLHSYNSLSPRSYQDFVRRLDGESLVYGRINSTIGTSALDTVDFKLANIGALVSSTPLSSSNLKFVGNYDGRLVYSVRSRWGKFMRLDMTSVALNGVDASIVSPDQVEPNAANVIRDRGDVVRIKLNRLADHPTLLVVSQSFNEGWRAAAVDTDQGRPLQLVRVNEALQGVIVPARTQLVELRFKSWASLAWISDAVFALMLIFGLALSNRRGVFRGSIDTAPRF